MSALFEQTKWMTLWTFESFDCEDVGIMVLVSLAIAVVRVRPTFAHGGHRVLTIVTAGKYKTNKWPACVFQQIKIFQPKIVLRVNERFDSILLLGRNPIRSGPHFHLITVQAVIKQRILADML